MAQACDRAGFDIFWLAEAYPWWRKHGFEARSSTAITAVIAAQTRRITAVMAVEERASEAMLAPPEVSLSRARKCRSRRGRRLAQCEQKNQAAAYSIAIRQCGMERT